MTTKLIGVKEFRQNIASYAKQARSKSTRYIVLNKNKPLFEVRPLSGKDLALEQLLADIEEARAQVKRGEVYALEAVMEEFGIA